MEEERAYSLGLRYLSRYSASRKRLIDYLKKKGIDEAIATEVASRFERMGYLNDLDYARSFVQRKKEKFGPYRLFGELVKKGVSPEIASEVLGELKEKDEKEVLIHIISGYLRKNAGLERKKLLKRLFGYLARRGFDRELVLQVLREVIEDFDPLEGEK